MGRGTTRYGFTPAEWDDTREQMRAILADVASRRETITYGDLAALISGGRMTARSAALVKMLGEVCESEDARRGVMLGSVVVRVDSRMPGDGYFAVAGGLGRDVADREVFWKREVERVWDAFRVPLES